jgi:hypothetical protein
MDIWTGNTRPGAPRGRDPFGGGEQVSLMGPGRPDIALGRYRLGRLLGRGATSAVYEAQDVHSGRPVAVKTIPASPELLSRIEVEIRAAQRLEHPNIVRLLDWGRGGDLVCLVWELVDGPSLAEACSSQRPTTGWATRRVIEILAALEHAHACGVVHRDIKPENILIDQNGIAHLADFGVARLSDQSTMTSAGSLVGTIAYMSPEQARAHPVGPPSDVYSASLVLYELLAGANPLVGGSAADTARRAALGDVPPIGAVRPDLPVELQDAIMQGLARDPSRRPSARRLSDDLHHAISGAHEHAVRQERIRKIRDPLVSAGASGAAMAGVLAGLGHLQPGEVLVGAGTAGAIALRWPRLSAGLVAGATVGLIGRDSIGSAVLAALGFALILALGWQWPRRLGSPLIGIAAAWVGLLPLACMLTIGVRTTRERVWAISSGLALTFAWELWTGRPLLLGPAAAHPLSQTARGIRDPAGVIAEAHILLAGSWWVVWGACGLVAAGLIAPLVVRTRPGTQRVVACLSGAGALVVIAIIGSPDPAVGVAAVTPSAILIAVWAARPWRTLARMGSAPRSATLRGPIL